MTTRDSNWPEGTPCWDELGVDDFDKGKEFYSRLLGWEIERGPEELGGYASCTREGRSVAGLSPKMDPAQPTAWTTYLATEDLEVTLQRVDAAGGRLLMDPMPVGDLGAMALVTDRAWTHNQRFYREVFGYEYDDLPGELEYATFKVDGRVAGGIGQIEPEMTAEMPSHWSVYFKVADVDAAVAELERMGGSVDRPAWDTEFGRIAAVADDQGAHFMLLADPRP